METLQSIFQYLTPDNCSKSFTLHLPLPAKNPKSYQVSLINSSLTPSFLHCHGLDSHYLSDRRSGSQTMVLGPAAAASGNSLEVKLLGPHLRATESETLGIAPGNL